MRYARHQLPDTRHLLRLQQALVEQSLVRVVAQQDEPRARRHRYVPRGRRMRRRFVELRPLTDSRAQQLRQRLRRRRARAASEDPEQRLAVAIRGLRVPVGIDAHHADAEQIAQLEQVRFEAGCRGIRRAFDARRLRGHCVSILPAEASAFPPKRCYKLAHVSQLLKRLISGYVLSQIGRRFQQWRQIGTSRIARTPSSSTIISRCSMCPTQK